MPNPYVYVLQSFEVHDADTVNAVLDLGFDLTFKTSVRVNGIDAPELNTQAGKKVTEIVKLAMQTLRDRKAPIFVVSQDWDKYGGRIVGDILFGENHASLAVRLLSLKLVQPFTGKVKKAAWTQAQLAFITGADIKRYASELIAV